MRRSTLLTSTLAVAAIGSAVFRAGADTPLPATPAPSAPAATPAEIPLAGWDAGAVRVPSAASAWGGERTGNEATLADRVADYRLRAVLDPVKHTVDGSATLTWRNRSDVPIRSLYFHMYLNGFESPDSTFMREKAKYGRFRSGVETKKGEWGYIELRSVTQGGRAATWTFVHPDGGPETDHTVIRVDLPEPVAAGASTSLDMTFFDQLPRVIARTGYFDKFHLVGQWYPKIGVLELPGERGATAPRWNAHEFHLHSEFYADWGAYEYEVVAPESYVVAGTGIETEAPKPVPGGLSHRFRQGDVHDAAFTAWDGYAPPLTAKYDGPGSPEVTVKVLAPAEYPESAKEALKATVDALGYFSSTLGPYPYSQVTAIVPPFNADEAGGMEYETFFTTDGGTGFPYDTPGLTRYVTVHEFGHGYFMGLLASNEFEEPFLDEGMNELWDTRMMQDERIQLHLPAPLGALGFRLPAFGLWDFEQSTGTRRHPADPIAGNSWERWSSASYGSVYARTVVVFHDLERLLGGDTFARGMKLYYARWHFRHPSTADLEQALIDGGGDRATVERWFAEQVYGAAAIDDRVEAVEAHEMLPQAGPVVRDGKRVEVDASEVAKQIEETRKQFEAQHGKPARGQPGPFPFRNVIRARRYGAHAAETVSVTFEDGTQETLAWPRDERWHEWVIERPVKAASAQVDPHRDYLLDVDHLDDGRSREPHPEASRRWALDTGAWTQVLLSLVETL